MILEKPLLETQFVEHSFLETKLEKAEEIVIKERLIMISIITAIIIAIIIARIRTIIIIIITTIKRTE